MNSPASRAARPHRCTSRSLSVAPLSGPTRHRPPGPAFCYSSRPPSAARSTTAALTAQTALLGFVVWARSSATWGIIAFAVTAVAVGVLAWRLAPQEAGAALERARKKLPCLRKIGAVAFVVLASWLAWNAAESARLDSIYFSDTVIPHHMRWHSAYIALTYHPEWPQRKAFPEQPDGGDGAAFQLFERIMKQRGEPFASPMTRGYRIRVHEEVIRAEYLKFLRDNPRFAWELFSYYKPKALIATLGIAVGSLGVWAWLAALLSVAMAATLLVAAPDNSRRLFDNFLVVGIVWGCSLIPPFWAYAGTHVSADQIASTLLFAMALSVAALVGAIRLWANPGRIDLSIPLRLAPAVRRFWRGKVK